MIANIRNFLAAAKFVPFVIHMADGRRIEVPTRDHIAVGRRGVVVLDDHDNFQILSGLLMTSVEANVAALVD